MTHEEALYRVKGYLTDIIPTENYSEVEEIIKALDQQPCEDAISREAVIRDFTQWREKLVYSIGEDYSGVNVLDKAIRVVKGMPSMPKGQSKCDLPQGDTPEVAVNERRSGRLSHGFSKMQ